VEIKLEKLRQHQEKKKKQLLSIPLKFKTAFEELCNNHELLTCGIEKIDSLLKLTSDDRLAVIGNRNYTQALIARLCVNALLLASPSSKKRINKREAAFFILLTL
jgi:hypothetical protein